MLDDHEMRELRRTARRHRMTVSEWVRQALRATIRREATGDPGAKTAAIRAAARHRFPAPDIDQMLSEIESSYLRDPTV